MMLDSLPERPLRSSEFDRLTESDAVAEGYVFAERGGSHGRFVMQFALDFNGEYAGFHFDPTAEKWELAGRASTFEEVSTALSAARGD